MNKNETDFFDDEDEKDIKKILKDNKISLKFLVQELKKVIDTSLDGRTKLAAVQAMLSLLGIDKKGKKSEDSEKGWEEILIEQLQQSGGLVDTGTNAVVYDVKPPKVPAEIAERKKHETEVGKELHYNPRKG